jgi:hypothetical protein
MAADIDAALDALDAITAGGNRTSDVALDALDAAADPQRKRRRRKKKEAKPGKFMRLPEAFVESCLGAEIVVALPCGWSKTGVAREAINAAKKHRACCKRCAQVTA